MPNPCVQRANPSFGSGGDVFSQHSLMVCTGKTPSSPGLGIRNQHRRLQPGWVWESALKGSMQEVGLRASPKMPFPPRSWGQVWQDWMTPSLYNEWHLDSSGEADNPTHPTLGLQVGWAGHLRGYLPGKSKKAFAKPVRWVNRQRLGSLLSSILIF